MCLWYGLDIFPTANPLIYPGHKEQLVHDEQEQQHFDYEPFHKSNVVVVHSIVAIKIIMMKSYFCAALVLLSASGVISNEVCCLLLL